MLPPGAGERPRRLLVRGSAEPPEALSERQQQIYDLLDDTPREAGRLRAALPGRVAARAFEAALAALVRRRLAERRYELSRPSGRPRVVEVVRLAAEPEVALRFAQGIEGRRASRRARALQAVLDAGGPVAIDELARIARGRPAVETLIEDGDVEIDGARPRDTRAGAGAGGRPHPRVDADARAGRGGAHARAFRRRGGSVAAPQ